MQNEIVLLDMDGVLANFDLAVKLNNKPTDEILNLEIVMEKLLNLNSKIKLIMEPGRFIVCESGILLTKVTQLKKKSKNNFYVGVNTGMNALMRPCNIFFSRLLIFDKKVYMILIIIL